MLKRKKQQECNEEVVSESKKKSGTKTKPQEEFGDDFCDDSRRTKGAERLPLSRAASRLDKNMISTEKLRLPVELSPLLVQSSSNQTLLSSEGNNGGVVEPKQKKDGFYDVKLNTDLVPGVCIIKNIGSGSYSTVWKALLRSENVERAVKISIGSERHNKLSVEEIKLLEKIRANEEDVGHKNICFYYGHYSIVGPQHSKHYAMLFELLPCNFRQHLRDIRTLSLERIQGFFSDILVALQFLHNTCGIVHADLKTENILVSNVGNPSSREVLKITDFGISFMKTDPPHRLITTCTYRAPEAFLCAQISTASDIWSFACIAFEIVRNSFLFHCQHLNQGFSKEQNDHFQFIVALLGPIEKKIFRKERHNEHIFEEIFRSEPTFSETAHGMRGKYLSPGYFVKYCEMPEWIAQNLVDFLLNSLQIDPKRRLTATQALKHSFMSLKNKNENLPVTVRFKDPTSPTYPSASPFYDTSSPSYGQSMKYAPTYKQKFPCCSSNSPSYSPTNPAYNSYSPTYGQSTSYDPGLPQYSPTSPTCDPTSPRDRPASPSCRLSSPTYSAKCPSNHS